MSSQRFSAFPKEGLRFLRSLKRNNNREWFQEHKGIYERVVKRPMEELVEALAVDFKEFAPEMLADTKSSIRRIYRDTRFSHDKTPYKTHVAAIFPRQGFGKHEGARLYLHISATDIYIGGGVYMPVPEDLTAIRTHIAGNNRAFTSIVEASSFRRIFGGLSGDQLLRVPRGFSADHPAADYLRYKQYLAGRTLTAEEALQPGFYKTVIQAFKGVLPFIRFLNDPILRAHRVRERQEALLTR
jgi:uncharacterized protein (TIGR02453 family)